MSWFHRIAQQPPPFDRNEMLFHGTVEPIEGALEARSWGKILWVAETPDVAQNYMPAAGSSAIVYAPKSKEMFRPFDINIKILNQMGYKYDVELDKHGNIKSWGVIEPRGARPLTYSQVAEYIENTLGYKPKYSSDTYLIKLKNGEPMPANYKMPGTLFILMGKSKLKLLDLTGGNNEDDLMDPTYNKTSLFTKAQELGYDGVRINDFAQSETWGNVGHKSIGIFPSGLAKMQVEQIPATNFDWGDRLTHQDTDEFTEWFKGKQSALM